MIAMSIIVRPGCYHGDLIAQNVEKICWTNVTY